MFAVFAPDDGTRAWRVALSPLPLPIDVRGLSDGGTFVGIRAPNYDELDQLMLQSRTGYRLRRRSTGAVEVIASTRAAAVVLCRWVAGLIASSQAT